VNSRHPADESYLGQKVAMGAQGDGGKREIVRPRPIFLTSRFAPVGNVLFTMVP